MAEWTGAHDMAYRVNAFREGTKRLYDGKSPPAGDGDMWLFELWHFLGDVEEMLKAHAEKIS